MEKNHNRNVMRAKAQELAQKKLATSKNLTELTPENTSRLLHELRIHQIQLEMQNEALRNAQLALEESRARYIDLYDFAPVGYCSIFANGGMIVEANLTLTFLLGTPRVGLIGKPFSYFVHSADQNSFHLLKKRILAEQALGLGSPEPSHSIELRLTASGGSILWVRLVASRMLNLGQQQLHVVVTDISASKQVVSELANNERRLRAIIETEPECVKLLDADGRLLEINTAGLRMMEAETFQQIENHCVYDLVNRTHRDAFRALITRVFQGESGILEFQITGLRGIQRWLEIHASPLRDDAGNITAALGITRDISARKLAEAALRLSDSALKSISQGVIITGTDYRVVSVNAAFSAITGYSAAEVLGRNCNFLQGSGTDPLTVAAIRLALKNRVEFAGEILNYRKIGTQFWNELTISPVFDAHGAVSHYIGVTRDITTRCLIEKANQEATMQLRLVIHGGDIGYWDWDVPSNELAVNDRWLVMLGLDSHGSPGIDLWHSLVHPEDRHKLAHLFESVIMNPNGVSGEVEIRARHHAGHDVWILDRFSVVDRDGDGKPLRVVGTHVDITQQKLAEAALREANNALRSSETQTRQRLREIEQIYAFSPIGLFTFDREHRFERLNERMAEINGFSIAHHYGKTLDEIVPELAGFIKAAYSPVFERGEPVLNVEIQGKTPQNPDQERDWICNYFPLRSEDGVVIGLMGAVLEITERKQAEREVQEQLYELQRWQEVLLGREDRVLELKLEVNELLARQKQPPRYASHDSL